MRIFVYDHGGYAFITELSRALAHSGHVVTHSTCAGFRSGKGDLEHSEPGLQFATVGEGSKLHRHRYVRRLVQELGYGIELCRQVRRSGADVVLVANAPVATLSVLALFLALARRPWVLWHQDLHGEALRRLGASGRDFAFATAGRAFEVLERWCARHATRIVVIGEAFVDVHRAWGTDAKVEVIHNWAPLDEVRPVARDNEWAREHGLEDRTVLLYAGTLGLKHDPELLVQLAAATSGPRPVRLVVVNEGPAVDVVRAAAAREGVDALVLPFQEHARLSEVLGAADVLVVLLGTDAGAFSVPSKTLSYLCAGRPVLGLMPADNLAADVLRKAGCAVFPPTAASIAGAGEWVEAVVGDPSTNRRLCTATRALAEQEFAIAPIRARFESVLGSAVSRHPDNVTK